jgi:hypothetical protein
VSLVLLAVDATGVFAFASLPLDGAQAEHAKTAKTMGKVYWNFVRIVGLEFCEDGAGDELFRSIITTQLPYERSIDLATVRLRKAMGEREAELQSLHHVVSATGSPRNRNNVSQN